MGDGLTDSDASREMWANKRQSARDRAETVKVLCVQINTLEREIAAHDAQVMDKRNALQKLQSQLEKLMEQASFEPRRTGV